LADKAKFQAIKGVRDILPPESALWNRVEQTAREVFGTFGFAEIRSPIFEQTDLFARSIGEDTDVVSKEMFSFVDRAVPDLLRWANMLVDWPDPLKNDENFNAYRRTAVQFVEGFDIGIAKGDLPKSPVNISQLHELKHWVQDLNSVSLVNDQSKRLGRDCIKGIELAVRFAELGDYLTLRPEATASVVRAYIEHGMQVQPGNVKLYYMGPMFRRERPQKGRYRQFYQIGAELLGTSDAPGIDAEVIEMLMTFFDRVNLKGATLYINSIGCKDENCRPAYVEKLRAELLKVRELLGQDSQRRIETNPLRVLDSKLESEQGIIGKLPHIDQNLCADCRTHYDEVKRQLKIRGILPTENWRLVRGLDYYMRTTFEITAPGLGSQNAVCGGGRYDGLVELLGGPATTKGIGFAIGTDRLVLSLQEAGEGETPGGPAGKAPGPDVYLAWFGGAAQAAAIGLARRLRDAGFVVELPAVEMKFGKSLGLADRLKARHAVIVGDDELAAGIVTVKRLSDGTQQKLGEPELFSYLRAV